MEYEGTVNRYSDDSYRLRLKVLVWKCKGETRARAKKESDIHSEKESGERSPSGERERNTDRDRVRRASGFEASVTSVEGFKVLCGSLGIDLVRKEVCLQILVRC